MIGNIEEAITKRKKTKNIIDKELSLPPQQLLMEQVSTNTSISTADHNRLIIIKVYYGIPPNMFNTSFKAKI